MEFDQARVPPDRDGRNDAIGDAPLSGTRAQSIQRLQVGLSGLAAMVLMVGLANIVIVSARQNQAEVVPEAIAETAADKQAAAEPASNPLADAGVVPDMPAQAPPERVEPVDPAILGDALDPAP